MRFDPARKCRTSIGWEDPRTVEALLAELRPIAGQDGRFDALLRHTEALLRAAGDDEFLASQLQPELLQAAARAKSHPLTLNIRPGHDHSYYFIASFLESHFDWHARVLAG